jgi:hypothetical protein
MRGLSGLDLGNAPFDLLLVAENVSMNRLLCGFCAVVSGRARLRRCHWTPGVQEFVKDAGAIRVDWPGTPGQACEFQFVVRPVDRVLPKPHTSWCGTTAKVARRWMRKTVSDQLHLNE